MIIEEINISNFGSISNHTIGPLRRSLTVIQGSNEAGKTTLLAFIRHILFGFPTGRTTENRYRLEGSDKHGGSITIVTADGERYTITRYGVGPAAGTVSVVKDDMTPLGEGELTSLLGHISKDIFQSIFAFDIDQLSGFDSANDELLASRLYVAGAGVNKLPSVMSDVRKKKDQIFLSGGRNQPVAHLLQNLNQIEEKLKEVNNQAPEYKDLNDAIISTNTSITETAKDLESTRARLNELNQWAEAHKYWVDLQINKNNKGELPDQIEFPEDAIVRLNDIETNLEELEGEYSEAQEEYEDIQKQAGKSIPNEFLISEIADIEFIRQSTEKIKSALNDLPKEQTYADDAKSRLNDELRSLGNDWTEERVKKFDISIPQFDEINRHKIEIEKFNGVVSASEGEVKKLKADRRDANERLHELKTKSDQQAKVKESRSKTKVLPSFLLIVGIVLGIYGYLENFQLLTGLGIGLSAFGLWMFKQLIESYNSSNVTVSGSKTESERQIQQLDKRLKQANDELREGTDGAKLANDNWTEWLRANNFPRKLSPDAASEFLSQVRLLSTNISEIEGHLARVEEMEEYLDEIRATIKPISDQLDIDLVSNDQGFLFAIEQIIETYKETKSADEHRGNSKRLADDLKRPLGRLETRLKTKTAQRDNLLRSGGTEDAEIFRRSAEEQNEHRELAGVEKDLRNKLFQIMGPSYKLNKLNTIFKSNDPESIEVEISKNIEKQEELRNENQTALKRSGELKNKIDQLIDDETASESLSKKAEYEDQLQKHAEEWSRMSLAIALLERTQNKYERERQPEILERASGYLNKLTNNRYKSVFNPIGGKGFTIVESGKPNSQKQPEQLSRGTKEQLYLSLRFASVEDFGNRREPLPVIVDEVLVNFDPQRATAAVESFLNVAEQNQVIVFTCHPWVSDLFSKADTSVQVISI